MISPDFEPVPDHDGLFKKRHALGDKVQIFVQGEDGSLRPTVTGCGRQKPEAST